jgi:hypothetical protein
MNTIAALEVTAQEWKSPAKIKQRITAIQQLMETTLKENVDYGIIPGMPKGTKPSLWKPGSEQILAMFQIAVEPMVEDLSTEDCFRYRVTTRLTNVQTGEFLGAGIGEASTDETKYKWRRTYSSKEYDETPAERRRIKYYNYNDSGTWKEASQMQVRQEPADLANTVLKIAKKRSQIDATLTVTGASSMFEQDLEDLTDETKDEMSRQRQPQTRTKTPATKIEEVICSECRATNGQHYPGCKFMNAEADKSPDQDVILMTVEAVDERDKKDRENKVTGKYLLIHGLTSPKNERQTLYYWHTGETAARLKAIELPAKCVFKIKKASNGAKHIEAIVEITGEKKPEAPF